MIDVKNKFSCLKEAELQDRVECCLVAQVVNKYKSSKKGVSVHAVGGADNIILVKESQKPVILVKSNEKFMTALLDTGSEKCLINYKNLNCLTKDSIKESNVVVKGVNSSNSVIGEVTLELQLNEQNIVSTNALILKDSNFSYKLILGRDLLKSSQIDLENRTITLNGERICFLEQKREKKPAKRVINENKDTSCLLNEVVSMRRRKRKKMKVEALCAEKVTVRDLNVHCHTMTIPANSINIINCFCRDVAAGEYIMPKHSLRNGLLIAESLVKIEEKPQGLVQSCTVLAVNMYDKDITVSDNGIVGSLIKYNSENVISESFLCNIDVSNLSKQNQTTNAGGGRRPSSMNCSSDFCEDSASNRSLQVTNKMNKLRANEAYVAENVCNKNADATSSLSGDCEKTDQDNRRKLGLDDIVIENKDFADDLLNLLNDFRDVVTIKDEKLGTCNIAKHEIRLKDKTCCVNKRQYQIPHKYKCELDKIHKQMERDGIIEESKSSFNSPLIVVKKKSGDLRPVIDFRELNKIVIAEHYPLPRIDDMLSNLGGAKIFSSLDLRSAFHQIELSEDSRELTAFSVNFRKYHFKKLPFGYCNSPGVFQSIMCKALQKLLGTLCFVFIDDILVFSKSVKSHLSDIKEVLESLRNGNLSVKLEKCSFFQSQVEYLGHRISGEGIACVNNGKLETMSRPNNVKELQRFLGVANFFRKFIPVFSRVAYPLYQLLRKDKEFIWDEACESAFIKLKGCLLSDVVLAHPNYTKDFHLFTDASNCGLGACLMQVDDEGQLKPLMYFSKSLNSAQKRYSTTKKEFLAIYEALREFRFIVLGYNCTVYTDHRPLSYLFKRKLPSDCAMARWSIEIDSFNVDVKYFEGKRNVVADFLSRIDGNVLLTDVLDNCENLTTKECETMMVTTRSAKDKLKLNDIDLTLDSDADDDDVNVVTRETDGNTNDAAKLIDYVPKFEEISWTIDELIAEQKRDPFCIEIINILRGKLDSNVRDLDSYILNEGILYRKRKFLGEKNYSAESTVLNIVMPSTLLQKAINYVHYRHHTGVKHTLFSFKLLYYHPNERSMVMTYVGNCDVCKILKGRVDVPIEIQTAPIARKPFEAVAIDFLGPLISTDSGNRYILSCVDLFSRFSVLNALPNRSSEAVISCLINIFDKFGYPRILLSDNALEFKANSVQLFAKINSVIKKEVLPFSPFSNGIVERRNTGITRLLKLYLNWVPHNNWDAFLSTVENTINNQLNISLGDTPAFVVFGRDTCPNIERKELSTIANLEDVENNVKYMARNRLFIQEFVRNNIINETKKRNTYRNKKLIVKNLEIGDRVLVRNHLKRNKLDLSWLGPGRVDDVGKNYCVLELGNKKIKSNLNHVIKLLGK